MLAISMNDSQHRQYHKREQRQYHHHHILLVLVDYRKDRRRGRGKEKNGNFFELDAKILLLLQQQ
jgi:hypothetical protein